ncbi:unnamed protein product [Closterium sp. Yama58-4]|nr:unnamed protein product [Closterium sp. Yama58-4]
MADAAEVPGMLTNGISGMGGAVDLLTSLVFRSPGQGGFPPVNGFLNGDDDAAAAAFGEFNQTDNGTHPYSHIDFQKKPALFLAQSVLNLVLPASSPLYPFIITLLSAFSPILDGFLQQYLHNDFFAGSVWLVAIGLVGRYLLSWFHWSLDWMRHRGNVTVTISPNDQAFTWIQEWLNGYKKLRPSEFTLNLEWPSDDEASGEDRNKPIVKFLPKLKAAQHITFNGAKVSFQMRNSPGQLDQGAEFGDILRSMNREELVIEAPSQAVLQAVVQAATDAAMVKKIEKKITSVKRWSAEQDYWKYLGERASRPVSTVVLDCDTGALIDDVKQFLASAKWYTDRGIPHRRGYLFHGPPGCGKTSLIQALAGELDFGVAIISLSSSGMSDDSLSTAMCDCDERDVIVLEDIDAAFTATREKKEGSQANGLSFSGLLNAIDGIAAREKQIVIMTTNHIERLDPALIRPGRVDFRMFLGLASRSQIVRLFLRFFSEASEKEAEKFAGMFEEGEVSPAALQGFFLLHRGSADAAMTHGPAFVEGVREERRERERKEEEKKREEEEGKGEGKGRRGKGRKGKGARKDSGVEEIVIEESDAVGESDDTEVECDNIEDRKSDGSGHDTDESGVEESDAEESDAEESDAEESDAEESDAEESDAEESDAEESDAEDE